MSESSKKKSKRGLDLNDTPENNEPSQKSKRRKVEIIDLENEDTSSSMQDGTSEYMDITADDQNEDDKGSLSPSSNLRHFISASTPEITDLLSTKLPTLGNTISEICSSSFLDHYSFDLKPSLQTIASQLEVMTHSLKQINQFHSFIEEGNLDAVYKYGYFGILPTELLEELFTWFDGVTLARLAGVCRLFESFSRNQLYWKKIVLRQWGKDSFCKELGKDWNWEFQCRTKVWSPDDKKKEGIGSFRFETGNHYYGEWKENKRHGKGVGIMADGRRYVGDWENDKRKGRGIFTWPEGKGKNSGDKYDGEWVDSKRHGKGIYSWAEGTTYNGYWRDGVRHGKATFTRSNKIEYIGDYLAGKMSGRGSMTWPDGSTYVGDFGSDKRHGSGTFVSSVLTYFGEWKNGVRHGYGVQILKETREQFQGEWRDDVPARGAYCDRDKNWCEKDWGTHDLQQFCMTLPSNNATSL